MTTHDFIGCIAVVLAAAQGVVVGLIVNIYIIEIMLDLEDKSNHGDN